MEPTRAYPLVTSISLSAAEDMCDFSLKSFSCWVGNLYLFHTIVWTWWWVFRITSLGSGAANPSSGIPNTRGAVTGNHVCHTYPFPKTSSHSRHSMTSSSVRTLVMTLATTKRGAGSDVITGCFARSSGVGRTAPPIGVVQPLSQMSHDWHYKMIHSSSGTPPITSSSLSVHYSCVHVWVLGLANFKKMWFTIPHGEF